MTAKEKQEVVALIGAAVAQALAQSAIDNGRRLGGWSEEAIESAHGPDGTLKEAVKTRRVIARHVNGSEHAASTDKPTFRTMPDAEIGRYMEAIYVMRDKEQGVYFHGNAMLFRLAFQRFYTSRKPFSEKQTEWARKMLLADERNTEVLREKYPAVLADLRKRNVTPQAIIDAQEADRKARKQARKALL